MKFVTIWTCYILRNEQYIPFPVIHLLDGLSQFIQLFHLSRIMDISTEDILSKGRNGTVHTCDSYSGRLNTDPLKPGERFAHFGGSSRQVEVDALICASVGKFQPYHAMPPI